MPDLFTHMHERARLKVAPLAARMRPTTLDSFVGQSHIIGPGKLLRRLLTADRLASAIFYGPPGTGKTTLAHIIAHTTQSHFQELNASAAGVKDVRTVIDHAQARLETSDQRTILFVDELHRFNKAQQDVLLHDVEQGTIIFIGATTENPFISVNPPLTSRSQIFQFEPLSAAEIEELLVAAIKDPQRGLGTHAIRITDEALEHLVRMSDGDARRALTALEIAVLSQVRSDEKSEIAIDLSVIEESIQQKAVRYDAMGDAHYDTASALIKSMRGSDPDAAVYWLARMLVAGEDPRFIARRICICASEDIGNADPMALVLANAAFQATQNIGMPECQLILAQAAIYNACAPKSNATTQAIMRASHDVREKTTLPVPKPLRDAHYPGAEKLGHGLGYQSAHEGSEGFINQSYLGVDRTYYAPTNRGFEKTIQQHLDKLRKLLHKETAAEDQRDSPNPFGRPTA